MEKQNIYKGENLNENIKKGDRMVLWPFNGKSGKKKQRNFGAVCSLGGLLFVAVGLATQIWITAVGIVLFLIGLVYLIAILD